MQFFPHDGWRKVSRGLNVLCKKMSHFMTKKTGQWSLDMI